MGKQQQNKTQSAHQGKIPSVPKRKITKVNKVYDYKSLSQELAQRATKKAVTRVRKVLRNEVNYYPPPREYKEPPKVKPPEDIIMINKEFLHVFHQDLYKVDESPAIPPQSISNISGNTNPSNPNQVRMFNEGLEENQSGGKIKVHVQREKPNDLKYRIDKRPDRTAINRNGNEYPLVLFDRESDEEDNYNMRDNERLPKQNLDQGICTSDFQDKFPVPRISDLPILRNPDIRTRIPKNDEMPVRRNADWDCGRDTDLRSQISEFPAPRALDSINGNYGKDTDWRTLTPQAEFKVPRTLDNKVARDTDLRMPISCSEFPVSRFVEGGLIGRNADLSFPISQTSELPVSRTLDRYQDPDLSLKHSEARVPRSYQDFNDASYYKGNRSKYEDKWKIPYSAVSDVTERHHAGRVPRDFEDVSSMPDFYPTQNDYDMPKVSTLNKCQSPCNLRPIVIDATDLAMGHGRDEVFSCLGIGLCVDYFKKRGHEKIIVYIPGKNSANVIPIDTEILDKLQNEGILEFLPGYNVVEGTMTSLDDEKFMVQKADQIGGVIISNKSFNKLADLEPSLRNIIHLRVLPYIWTGGFGDDGIKFPTQPLGPTGPGLEELLRFNE